MFRYSRQAPALRSEREFAKAEWPGSAKGRHSTRRGSEGSKGSYARCTVLVPTRTGATSCRAAFYIGVTSQPIPNCKVSIVTLHMNLLVDELTKSSPGGL